MDFKDGGTLDFGPENALGFVIDGRIFEYQDGKAVEVEAIQGDLSGGWSFTISASDDPDAD